MERFELGGHISGGLVIAVSSGFAALKGVIGQESHMRFDILGLGVEACC